MISCVECGSITIPIWESNDRWALVTVCMKCVGTRHWTGIKLLSSVTILGSLLAFMVGLGLAINALMLGAIVAVIIMEVIILLIFCPFPLYGENRRRYKEWKKGMKNEEGETAEDTG